MPPKNQVTCIDINEPVIHLVRKKCRYIFASDLLIDFKNSSADRLAVNFQWSDNNISHYASNVSLHYLVKYSCQKRHPASGTCIVINDTSQGSVATWYRCGGTFDCYLLQIYWWVYFERFFFKFVSIWRSYGLRVDCLKRPARRGRPIVLLKGELAWDEVRRMACRNCCDSIKLRLLGLLLNKITINIMGWIFLSATVSNGWILHGSLLHSALEHGAFWAWTFRKV